MVQLITSFKKLNDEELLSAATRIQNSLINNPNFLVTIPSQAEYAAALDAYSVALQNMGHGPASTMQKEHAREMLENTLFKLGSYINALVGDDEIMAGSSGFEIRRRAEPIGVLAKPQGFKAAPGPARGSVKLSMRKIRGASIYQYEYKMNGGDWVPILHTSTSILIQDLISGQEYTFRAVAIGANPVRVYSDEIKSFIL